MVHTNKVLTVSYGTFSCTLEGFDDSFGTMKAIAEYFRDLAADDRYFGAEPPQPDAEMLARIAQKEISRRVEVHSDDGGFVLRAGASDVAADAPAAITATQAASTPVDEPPVAEPPVAESQIEVKAEEPANDTTALDDAETKTQADAASSDVLSAELPEAKTAPDLDHSDEEAAAEPALTVDPEQATASDGPVEGSVDAFFASTDADLTEETVEDLATEVAEAPVTSEQEATPDPDSIAAKLQRIRDVVARGDVVIQDGIEPETAEDSTLQANVATVTTMPVSTTEAAPAEDNLSESDVTEDVLGEAAREISAALQEDFAGEDLAGEEFDETYDDADDASAEPDQAIDAHLPEQQPVDEIALAGAMADAGDQVEEDLPEETTVAQDAETTPEPRPFDLAAFEAVTAEALSEEDSDDLTEEEVFADEEEAVANNDASDDDANAFALDGQDTIFAGLDDEDEDDGADDDAGLVENILAAETPTDAPQPAAAAGRARVVKVRRSDLENAIESGEFEPIEEDEATAPSELSAEDEADLMRELAEVEEEFSTVPVAHPEEDMPRLLAEAGEKMKDEESAANREAFAQLRAAVAATKAEEKVSGKPPLLTLDKEYRDDLAKVVRPTRPLTQPQIEHKPEAAEEDRADSAPAVEEVQAQRRARTRPATRRPSSDMVAPLKLVAEQRVDESDSAPRAPVRPRRVTTQLLDDDAAAGTADSADGFAAFAEKVGATGLSELLEAAAAYMSYVEGRDQFSRPQLMTKVRLVEKDDFNREDGLRSFGQLLRQGKISKTGSGRFTAAPDIGFRPDQRAAS